MTFLVVYINILFEVLQFTIMARIILSWFQGMQPSRLYLFLVDSTQPIMRIAQKITPRIGMFDFSPIVALFGLELLRTLLLTVMTGQVF